MKTIAICNHKGGVGKTALSMAIAEGLHRKGKRTQRQEHDAQQGGQHDAAGGKLLIVVELDGEH